MEPQDFVGRIVDFTAAPYEYGRLRITQCEWAESLCSWVPNHNVLVVGVVESGYEVSRLGGRESRRDITNRNMRLHRVSWRYLRENNHAHYTYGV